MSERSELTNRYGSIAHWRHHLVNRSDDVRNLMVAQ